MWEASLCEPLLDVLSVESAGEATDDLDTVEVPDGVEWQLNYVAAEDETTTLTSIRVGIVRGLSFAPLVEERSPAAATLYYSDRPFYLRAGQKLRARFTGATSGDKLKTFINGLSRRVR